MFENLSFLFCFTCTSANSSVSAHNFNDFNKTEQFASTYKYRFFISAIYCFFYLQNLYMSLFIPMYMYNMLVNI